MSSVRNPLLRLGALAASLLILTGCAAGPAVTPTGNVTEVTVQVEGMQYVPDTIDVPVGDELIITLENTGTVVHDLVFDNGRGSLHLGPGKTEVIDVGVIAADMDGWCSVSNHRAMGMELTVRAVG